MASGAKPAQGAFTLDTVPLPLRLCVFKGLNLTVYKFEELVINPTSESLKQSKKVHAANLGSEVLLSRKCDTAGS